MDKTNASLRAYDLAAGVWSLTGSGLSVAGIGYMSIAKYSSSSILLAESSTGKIKQYSFSGSAWSFTTSGSSPANSFPSMSIANSTILYYISKADGKLRTMQFYTGNNLSFAMSVNLGTDLYDGMNNGIHFEGTALSSVGMNTMVRISNGAYKHRRNEVVTHTINEGFNDWCNQPLMIGALGPISNNLYSNEEVVHMYVAAFTEAEAATYEGLVNTLQGDIETALGLSAGSRKKY